MKEHGNTKHGHGREGGKSQVYIAWINMRQRCYNKNKKDYSYYGGRGIRVEDSWHVFKNFLADMGEPLPGQTLDRIDPNGNYCADNCRWATRKEQTRNRRDTVRFEYKGENLPVSEWAEKLSLTYGGMYNRIRTRSWDPDRVVNQKRRRARA